MANTRVAQLPNQIPPQSAPVLMDGGNGTQVFETNWWLFLYNIASQVISLGNGSVTLPDSVNIALVDSEVVDTDSLQAARQVLNLQALLGAEPDVGPSLRDLSNAFLLATDGVLQDPTPRAQPVAAVTVTASPFTFTAPANGTLAISVGTVSAVVIIRQGVTVPTGLVDGLIPVSRLDQVQITYAVAPTVNFLPA
jgi:hypothetical protein